MRKLTFILTLLVLTSLSVKSQYRDKNYLLLPELINKTSISGIICFNNHLYLAAERCGMIFISSLSSHEIIDTIILHTNGSLEIEGITAYKDNIYIISENNSSVYEVNRETGNLNIVKHNFNLPQKFGDDGFEGIAANEKNSKFYLLLERDKTGANAWIYTFSIDPANPEKRISLKYESSTPLKLGSPLWRYSDIFFDSSSNMLVCLKSYFKDPKGKYSIESIQIDEKGLLSIETLKTLGTLTTENLTNVIDKYKKQGYESNLEGITMDDKGNIYLASDNSMGRADCEPLSKNDDKPKKTLVLMLIK
jgi:hypothetical protein